MSDEMRIQLLKLINKWNNTMNKAGHERLRFYSGLDEMRA